ncbi:unnamed protein product [Rotaria magnacalcarata]|uniref:O-methyltransferase C-terminal domain-containing protein n=1 Tax=Rotaria magnacalcarata TaxID=392030 RepID=A0A816V6T8_9BILA|nr:unnamed protein product [Rotaria magnacalcarata]CAF3723382.1 unnamed protein product [Rotaria magnacalcarata]
MAESKNTIVHSPLELKGLAKYLSLTCHRALERGVWTFCELGIADIMADYQAPITAKQLSQLNGNTWNAEFLYRLLRVIADVDIVKEIINNGNDNEDSNRKSCPEETVQYQLTDDGLLLTSNHSSRARDMIRLDLGPHADKVSTYLPSLIKFGYKNGNGFEQVFGCSLFEYMQKEENKEYANIFDNSMVAYSNLVTSSIVSLIDFTRFNKLVDVAGGLGTLLSSILEKHPNLQGILFDLPHVIGNAKTLDPNEFQQKQVESTRYEFAAGDMFKSETLPSADAYLLKYIIHDWNDEKAVEILQSIRNANKDQIEKTITVFIVEMVILSNRKDNWETHALDLEMLCGVSSKERNLFEYISLLNKSGYELKDLHKTQGIMSIIEAVTTTSN